MEMIKARQMKLGDVVRTGTDAFADAIVKKITDKHVTLFRPYGHASDFSYTGGVICYTGTEEWDIPLSGEAAYELLYGGKVD